MKINVLGIDLAKDVFELHGVDTKGRTLLKKTVKRAKFLNEVINLQPAVIAMEACGSSNYWARKLSEKGLVVKLISPQFVRPFLKSCKNDANDAEAIAEAANRPSMRFVGIKTQEQQDTQCLHRIRSRLIRSRTATANEIRGLLSEYGIVIKEALRNLKKELPLILEDAEVELTMQARSFFKVLYDELMLIEEKISFFESKIINIYRTNDDCKKISEIKGVGPVTATAVVSAVGSGVSQFKNGRQFAAWLGLVPKQHSSGGKSVLLGITKRGDRYLRALLVHGARSVVARCESREDRFGKWIYEKKKTRGYNKAAVALANKNARIIWALLKDKNARYNYV